MKIVIRLDYVAWRGANADLVVGRQGLAYGTDTSKRVERGYSPRGPNPELRAGSTIGLATGSIYSQMKREMANVKVN